VGIITDKEAIPAELVTISHPIAFLEGTMGQAPPVEDLHVALLESTLRPAVHKVLQLLPRRPLLRKPTPAPTAAAVDTASAADTAEQPGSSSTSAVQPSSQPPPAAAEGAGPGELYGGDVPEEMIQLLPSYWDQVGVTESEVPPLGSKALMRLLQASSWAEEFRDPATSQVRRLGGCGGEVEGEGGAAGVVEWTGGGFSSLKLGRRVQGPSNQPGES
jgi:hypothetical protein